MPANFTNPKEYMLSCRGDNLPEIANYEVIKSEPADTTITSITIMNPVAPNPPQLYHYQQAQYATNSIPPGVPVGHVHPQINGSLPGPAGQQRRTIPGNIRKQQRSAPYQAPANDDKLNIRRKRNREAAQRCRQRRLDLIDQLQEKVKELDDERKHLSDMLRKEQDDKRELLAELESHARDCDRGINEKLRQLVEDTLPVMVGPGGCRDFSEDQTVPYDTATPPLSVCVGSPRSPPMYRSNPAPSSSEVVDGYFTTPPTAALNDSNNLGLMHIKSEIVSANSVPFKISPLVTMSNSNYTAVVSANTNSNSTGGFGSQDANNCYGQMAGYDNSSNSVGSIGFSPSSTSTISSAHYPGSSGAGLSVISSAGAPSYSYGAHHPVSSSFNMNRPSSLQFSSGPMSLGGAPLETPSSAVFCYDPKVSALLEQSTGLTPVTNTGLTPLLAGPSASHMGSSSLETPSITTASLTSL